MPGEVEVLAPNYRRLPSPWRALCGSGALLFILFHRQQSNCTHTLPPSPRRKERATDRPCSSLGRPSTAAAAETETNRGFKRSSEVGWLAVFVVVSLFHVIVLSSPLSLVRPLVRVRSSPLPTCGVWTASPASSLSSSDQSRAGGGEERRTEEKSIVPPSP